MVGRRVKSHNYRHKEMITKNKGHRRGDRGIHKIGETEKERERERERERD